MNNQNQELNEIIEMLKRASAEELHTIIIFVRKFLGE